MKPGPIATANLILETLDYDQPPIALVELITRIALEQKWVCDQVLAREKAEAWHDAALTKLQDSVNASIEAGRPSRIAFNSSSSNFIQGVCWIEPRDPPDAIDKKTRRLRLVSYAAILDELTPRDFELLCGKLIGLLGVQTPTVTRSSADEGIDFYGVLSLESVFFPHDLTSTIQRQLSIWLVGQAKHYKAIQSGTSEIRDLVGAIALGRANTFGSLAAPFKDFNPRVTDPVFALLITTGTFSVNAWRLLRRSGVIGMDGEMVAAFLADRGAGLNTPTFQRDEFLRWIQS